MFKIWIIELTGFDTGCGLTLSVRYELSYATPLLRRAMRYLAVIQYLLRIQESERRERHLRYCVIHIESRAVS